MKPTRLVIEHRGADSSRYEHYFRRELTFKEMYAFLERKVEETRATDNELWDHTAYKVALEKLDKLHFPGNLHLTDWSINWQHVLFED